MSPAECTCEQNWTLECSVDPLWVLVSLAREARENDRYNRVYIPASPKAQAVIQWHSIISKKANRNQPYACETGRKRNSQEIYPLESLGRGCNGDRYS
jgi:hypothetical protein